MASTVMSAVNITQDIVLSRAGWVELFLRICGGTWETEQVLEGGEGKEPL